MGMIQIKAWGSFPTDEMTFTAQNCGHAVAVEDAIERLKKMLPEAIKQDRTLRTQGHMPDDNFVEADKRGIFNDSEEKTEKDPG